MFSKCFGKVIAITDHARERINKRLIDENLLLDIIETGSVKHKDEVHIWIAKQIASRADNLLCVAAVLETRLVIKTVMHSFSWGAEQ